MDTDPSSKKTVTLEQQTELVEFMKENIKLARGLTRGRRGKLHSLKLWRVCAERLNNFSINGAIKDEKGWSKYWCDWKYRVRRRALELKAAKANNPPSEDVVELSLLELSIIDIIGEGAIDGVVVKSDPLANGDIEEEPENPDNTDDIFNSSYDNEEVISSPKVRKRRHSSRNASSDGPGTSSATERKPKMFTPRMSEPTDFKDDEQVTEFIRIEEAKLENSNLMLEAVQSIATQISRLADVMTHIRDTLINNRLN